MQIVIEIDDMAYKFVQNTSFVEDESILFKQTNADREKTLFLYDILDAIKSGTPLPKGHGRLIDANSIYQIVRPIEEIDVGWGMTGETAIRLIHEAFNRAPTIVEADKAGDEE